MVKKKKKIHKIHLIGDLRRKQFIKFLRLHKKPLNIKIKDLNGINNYVYKANNQTKDLQNDLVLQYWISQSLLQKRDFNFFLRSVNENHITLSERGLFINNKEFFAKLYDKNVISELGLRKIFYTKDASAIIINKLKKRNKKILHQEKLDMLYPTYRNKFIFVEKILKKILPPCWIMGMFVDGDPTDIANMIFVREPTFPFLEYDELALWYMIYKALYRKIQPKKHKPREILLEYTYYNDEHVFARIYLPVEKMMFGHFIVLRKRLQRIQLRYKRWRNRKLRYFQNKWDYFIKLFKTKKKKTTFVINKKLKNKYYLKEILELNNDLLTKKAVNTLSEFTKNHVLSTREDSQIRSIYAISYFYARIDKDYVLKKWRDVQDLHFTRENIQLSRAKTYSPWKYKEYDKKFKYLPKSNVRVNQHLIYKTLNKEFLQFEDFAKSALNVKNFEITKKPINLSKNITNLNPLDDFFLGLSEIDVIYLIVIGVLIIKGFLVIKFILKEIYNKFKF